jgi:hypothetical protein
MDYSDEEHLRTEDEILDLLSEIQVLINDIRENHEWDEVINALMDYYDYLNALFINAENV